MKTLTLVTASVLALATASAFADERIRTRMTGYQEVPSVSTAAAGEFDVKIHPDGQAFDWVLSYSGLQGDVLQAHIHFAQRSVNGAIVVWLCGSATNPGPAGTPACPQSGTVSGTAMAGNVGPGSPTQQLTAGEIGEVIAAMRAGAAYANVHTTLTATGEIRGQIGRGGRGRGHR
jgi:hypothetical protein